MNQLNIEDIWKRYNKRLLLHIKRKISDPFAAEDILQDVFLKIQKHMDTLREKEKLESWLLTITNNTIIDKYRTRKSNLPLEENLQQGNIKNTLETVQGVQSLKFMIENLPEPYSQTLLLSEFEGLTQKEIALRLGLSTAGVKSRIQRGKKLLDQKLKQYCVIEYDRHGRMSDCNCTPLFPKAD